MSTYPAGMEAAGYVGVLALISLLVLLQQSVTEWARAYQERKHHEQIQGR